MSVCQEQRSLKKEEDNSPVHRELNLAHPASFTYACLYACMHKGSKFVFSAELNAKYNTVQDFYL